MTALLLLACTPREPWWQKLEADSPCYRVDLKDGLDEQSTAELHDLYDCVNRNDHFSAFDDVDAVLDTDGIGADVARWTNAMTSSEADPLFLISTVGQLVVSDVAEAEAWLELFVEVGWGRPIAELDPDTLNASFEGGLLVPLEPGLQRLAGELRHDPLEALPWLGRGLSDAGPWVRTAGGWQRSSQVDVAELPRQLGEALQSTHSPANDRWNGATGDSLRDLAVELVASDLATTAAPPVYAVLDDDVARSRIEAVFVDLHEDGHLQNLLAQLERLVSVDAAGESLQPGEDAAFRSFVRLIARGNEPLVCTVDLGLFDIHLTFGNLSVSVLDLLAELDPEAAQDATGLLSGLLGFGITEGILVQIANGGSCPPLDAQMLSDLRAVDAMQSEDTQSVFVALVRLLDAAKRGEQNRIPALVDLVSALEEAALFEPLEEVIRDVGPTPFAREVVELIPALADPSAHGVDAGPDEPIALSDILDAARDLMEPDGDTTGLERLRALLEPAVDEPGTWVAVGRGADLLANPDSQASRILERLPGLLAADPELKLLRVARPLFDEPTIREPLLDLLVHPAVLPTLFASQPPEGQELAPLPFIAARVLDGGAVDLLRTAERIREGLGP